MFKIVFVILSFFTCILIHSVDFKQELRYLDYKNCTATSESIHVMGHYGSLYKAFADINLIRELHKARDLLFSHDSFGQFFKVLLLFGFLTLQGSQPALAAPNLASGLQSIPYLTDLGGISTGFASVRKISL